MNQRGQVDLIDMQSFPSGEFKYVLVYQDHGAKFCVLAALKKRTVREVVLQLLSIFATLGPPKLLQTDNGGEFSGIAGAGRWCRSTRPSWTRSSTTSPNCGPHASR